MSHTWTLTKMRIRLAMRNRAFFFFSVVMPLLFLFGAIGAITFLAKGSRGWIAYVLGAVLTLTVMGSFWGLSVQIVTFREQGILRRFRALSTPTALNRQMYCPWLGGSVLVPRPLRALKRWVTCF